MIGEEHIEIGQQSVKDDANTAKEKSMQDRNEAKVAPEEQDHTRLEQTSPPQYSGGAPTIALQQSQINQLLGANLSKMMAESKAKKAGEAGKPAEDV